ncbi:MAG TPA: glutathione S-transferase family protein [Gammaproteobacteria bacterium]|nr:glutathione S-transferase family protein [Gammaproteobacteria bacterium]
MMINGQWQKDFDPIQDSDEEGRFRRVSSTFRNWITPDGSPGPQGQAASRAEAERYHLYVALICPWACRTLMARKLKKLEAVISVTVVNPVMDEQCWRFGGCPGAGPEPFYGLHHVHQLYSMADPKFTGQVTVPVLWDKQARTIVNNESADILRILNRGFGDLASDEIDLCPPELEAEIDAVNQRLYDSFNNGVYRAGFAQSQQAYEEAVADVFGALDYLQQRLQRQDYLVGNRFTEADIRAFVTLIRFDVAYHGLFKTNLRQIRDYPAVFDYLQRIYHYPGMAETVNIDHIKRGYYSLRALNPGGIVPAGPEMAWLK